MDLRTSSSSAVQTSLRYTMAMGRSIQTARSLIRLSVARLKRVSRRLGSASSLDRWKITVVARRG